MMKDQLPHESNELIGRIVPDWLKAFVVLLGAEGKPLDTSEGWDGLGIKKEIYKVRCPFPFSHHAFGKEHLTLQI